MTLQLQTAERNKLTASFSVPDSLDSATWVCAQQLGRDAAEFARFQDEPAQMRSGSVGKNGFLHLGFTRRGARTLMVDVRRRAPFLVQRALYWDQEMPDMACVYLLTSSGGILQGDRYALEIDVSEGACAHLTTQGATRIQSMDSNYAAQAQTIRLQDNAYLEWLPEPMMPYRQSRFLLDTRIEMAPSSSLLYGEILLPGRRYHHPDEYFGFDVFSSQVRGFTLDGRETFGEKYVLEPHRNSLRQIGVMGTYDIYANVLLLTPEAFADRVFARVGTDIDAINGVAYGASRLPNSAGLIFKVLGNDVLSVKARVREFWAIARQEIKNRTLPAPFLWRQ